MIAIILSWLVWCAVGVGICWLLQGQKALAFALSALLVGGYWVVDWCWTSPNVVRLAHYLGGC